MLAAASTRWASSASRRRILERARRRWLGPLFERLGYDLLPAVPEWRHRPLSDAEVERLLSGAGATESLEGDLSAAGILSAEPSTGDWSAFDFRGVDLSGALAFFDDHVSQAQRILEARERGIRHILFDDDAAAHCVHSHGGPAFPTVAMILGGVDRPVRWLRNGREFRYEPDIATTSTVRAAVAAAHAFDDLHRVTGYSPARLCYVAIKSPDR